MSKDIESKREEFRKYLERSGVMDALTKVLVQLYDEVDKPEVPLEFLRSNLGDKRPPMSEIENMRCELELNKRLVKELQEEIRLLKGDGSELSIDNGEGNEETPSAT